MFILLATMRVVIKDSEEEFKINLTSLKKFQTTEEAYVFVR